MSEAERIRDVYARRRATGQDARYTVFDRANLFRLLGLERDLALLLRNAGRANLAGMRALDAGCGGGWWLRTLLRWGAHPGNLAGIDLLPQAVTSARAVHPATEILQGSIDHLPFADGAFDLISQFTVFSSILDRGMQRRAAAEMLRVLRPGGAALWYDFTVNPRNRDTRGIGRETLRALFPGSRFTMRRVTLAPPLARLVAPRSWLAAELLGQAPPLRTHLLALIEPGPARIGGPPSRNSRS